MSCLSSSAYLHPNAAVEEAAYAPAPPHAPLEARDAARIAAEALQARGARDVRVCAVRWIAAPVGGYLVDALGELDQDGVSYTLFRVGVLDGADDPAQAGREFVFIARGQDAAGQAVWSPPLGSGDADAEAALAYEFLPPGERGDFERLPERYR